MLDRIINDAIVQSMRRVIQIKLVVLSVICVVALTLPVMGFLGRVQADPPPEKKLTCGDFNFAINPGLCVFTIALEVNGFCPALMKVMEDETGKIFARYFGDIEGAPETIEKMKAFVKGLADAVNADSPRISEYMLNMSDSHHVAFQQGSDQWWRDYRISYQDGMLMAQTRFTQQRDPEIPLSKDDDCFWNANDFADANHPSKAGQAVLDGHQSNPFNFLVLAVKENFKLCEPLAGLPVIPMPSDN